MPLTVINATGGDAWMPEIWAQELALELKKQFVLTNTVNTDYSGEVARAGDVVNVPVPPVFTASNVRGDSGTTTVTLTNVPVQLNRWKHVPLSVDEVVAVQSRPQVLQSVVRSMATALAEAVERDLMALYTSASATVGTAGTNVTAAVIRNGLQKLDENGVPRSGRYIVLSAKDYYSLLGDANLAPYFAQQGSTIQQGEVGNLYGATVLLSQMVPVVTGTPTTTYNLAYHRDAIVLVSRPLPPPSVGGVSAAIVTDDALGISFRLILDYDTVQKTHILSADILYGVAVVRPQGLVQILG